jgi:predicted dehydrogenase
MSEVGVAVIGCGLIGERRAAAAAAGPGTVLRLVVDTDADRAQRTAACHGADAGTEWQQALSREDVGAVVVCTPNALLVPIATAALAAGRHTLIEKPMGRNVAEAGQLAAAANASTAVLKIGFNHRYHPGIARAAAVLASGEIGRLIQLRARYGHGSRPGCEQEWRGNAELAGGGELLDQGVHIIDLFQWLAGPAIRVHAELQQSVWPLGPLEDNAFALMRFDDGVVGQMHVSMTQWKNLFSLEVHGDRGAVTVQGLGGSYGPERLTVVRRNMAGGVPDLETTVFEGPDLSWAEEWLDFVAAMGGAPLRHGRPEEGLLVMQTVAALYEAAGGEGGDVPSVAAPVPPAGTAGRSAMPAGNGPGGAR